MEVLQFYKFSPSGNTTVLIVEPSVESTALRASLANVIMDSAHLGAEQVGYVSFLHDGTPRLDMMGGEFCGNATRALLTYLVDINHKSLIKINRQGKDALETMVSVSGVQNLLKARVFKSGELVDTEVEMPLEAKITKAFFESRPVCIVKMDGITHVLLNTDDFQFPEDSYREFSEKIRAEFQLTELDAVGVIWWTANTESNFEIKPVVWVKNTDSLYYETACGSGTAALAIALAEQSKKSISILVKQPSNKTISANILCDSRGVIQSVAIGGIVDIIAKGELYCPNF
jgi:diaminopimelate epimerase